LQNLWKSLELPNQKDQMKTMAMMQELEMRLFDLEKKVRSFIVIIQTFTVDNLSIQFALLCDDLILQEQDRT
jgi:hypothetical protein